MVESVLSCLNLAPEEVPALPAKTRNALIAYFLRWQQYEDARLCLLELVAQDEGHVTLLDSLARAYIGLNQAEHAMETMRHRHALRVSASSQTLEAEALLAAGYVTPALAIAYQLTAQYPDSQTVLALQITIAIAAKDWEGAEAALRKRESYQPEGAGTALLWARYWLARGNHGTALLWSRTALNRYEHDEHRPPIDLLHLLALLYDATDQPTQAKATSAEIHKRHEDELEELRGLLGLTPPARPREQTAPPSLAKAPSVSGAEHQRLDSALRQFFGHEAFRPGQAEALACALRGESVLAVMPTGAGKSLCYQLAAMLLPATTLVISPLIALMKDQLDGLPTAIAPQATALNHTLDGSELEARLVGASDGRYKLLYAAPERLRQRPFLHALRRAGVSLLVVDEAHCVSLWGHDFRPDYRFISKAWHELGQPPIMAVTATATPRVQDDVQAALGKMHLVTTGIQRPNLRLEARRFSCDEEKRQALLGLCQELKGSGIVYASSRDRCERLAALLRHKGISAIHYHAGIDDRAAAQERFMSGAARIVVATIAFGMGIDKADVRFIIHYNPPKTLENYFQEAGRAGRDGLPARCILFHTAGDKANLNRFARQDSLSKDDLRAVYAAIQHRLGSRREGLLAVADLERDLAIDETRMRVAIHFLQVAGLLVRGFDLPRCVTLTVSRAAKDQDPAFLSFVEAACLRPGQSIARDTCALSQQAGIGLDALEAQLLAWRDAGWIQYRGTGRDMLLSLPEPPADSAQRVSAMLADYSAGQQGRIADIISYATTRTCRHGFISAYFGEAPIEQCAACDNCLADRRRLVPAAHANSPAAHPGARPRQETSLAPDTDSLFQALRAWRREKARQLGRAPFVVFHDAVLLAIAGERPRTLTQMGRIRGVGPRKLDAYGQEILALVADCPAAPEPRSE
jgi:ATP-dependent DNA helicase RecQ